MPHRSSRQPKQRKLRARRKWRFAPARWWPGRARRKQWLRAWRRLPAALRLAGLTSVVLALWLGTNGAYQVVRKPSELLFPISESFFKTPARTWTAYAPLFERHSTAVMTPALLAALAQIEASGNPVARTYWRWAWTRNLFEIFRPASSAVGMYQITNSTFAEARRYCIHDHLVVAAGAWYSLDSCWFNGLYTRLVPSHAVELTSAYLDRRVAEVLRAHPVAGVTLEQKQALAAVIHLCGAGAGARYARAGLRVAAGQRCGAHDLAGYLGKLQRMQQAFRHVALT
jgi:hypothetical protein